MSKLSIIVPHYNSPELLMTLLDSIPKNEEIQVLVVDDNSTEKMDAYKLVQSSKAYEHVSFLTNTRGVKGAGAARNHGIKFAKGKWVLFADADDYFLEGFYKEIQKYMQKDLDVVFFPATSIELETGELSDRHLKYAEIMRAFQAHPGKEETLKLRYGLSVPWSKLINRDFIERNQIRFDEVLASNDILFSAKVGRFMAQFDVAGETIYCVTKRQGTLTQNISEEVFDARVNAFISYYHFLQNSLKAQEFASMRVTGKRFLVVAFKYKLGMQKVFQTYRLFKKSKVKIVDAHSLSPFYIMNRVSYHYKDRKKNSRYYTKTIS